MKSLRFKIVPLPFPSTWASKINAIRVKIDTRGADRHAAPCSNSWRFTERESLRGIELHFGVAAVERDCLPAASLP